MTRQDRIEAAARELVALEDGNPRGFTFEYERESAIGAEKAKLRAALALPADPVSVDVREGHECKVCGARCVDGVMAHGTGCYQFSANGGGEESCDAPPEIPTVNATHPRAPSVEAAVLAGALADAYDQAARVCDDAATGAVDPGGIRRCAARIRALAPDCENCGEPSCTSSDCVRAIEAAAPSAPRDQGGGLREWDELRTLVASQKAAWVAAELADGDCDKNAPALEQKAADIDDEVSAWTLGHAEQFARMGAPPTDGVAATYERGIADALKACDRYIADATHPDPMVERYGNNLTFGAVKVRERIAALAPVSEKERAK